MEKKDNRSYYNAFSETYENRRHSGYHALLDEVEAGIAQEYTVDKSVLEVGCGTGLIMKRLQSKVSSIHGIDISEGMLSLAKAKGLKVGLCSVTSLPYKDNSFDVVYSYKVLAHIKDIKTAMKEIARVTKPGGIVITEFYNTFSFRGFRWFLKKLIGAEKTSRKQTEDDIFTRYDTYSKIMTYIPDNLKIIRRTGAMTFTPFAAFLKLPLLGKAFSFAEKKSKNSTFVRLSGFMIVVCTKAK